MKTIKDILDSLPKEKRNQLMYAFEHNLSQYIHLPDNEFIGVNVQHLKHLFVRESAGVWSVGVNAGPKDEVIT